MYEQSKTVDRPLQGGGILTAPSQLPRQILLSLPGINQTLIEEFEGEMKRKRSAKEQKDIIRDLLRVAADNLKENDANASTTLNGGTVSSLFDRAIEEESLLHSKLRRKAVPDLPEKLKTQSQVNRAAQRNKHSEFDSQGLSAFSL